MPVAKEVLPGETLNTTDNYTCLMDKGGGKASACCVALDAVSSESSRECVITHC